MTWTHNHKLAGSLVAAFLALSATGTARAAPLSVAGPSIISPQPQIEQARYKGRVVRRHVRRGGVGAGAALSIFGSVLGAAIASSNNNDDYYDGSGGYYAPGPYYYGGGGRAYRGGGFRGGGVHGGGFRGHAGVAHGGGRAFAHAGTGVRRR